MANVDIKPITRLLVANRGEIARRIFRSAHDMGISTVAVYADGDANAPFVTEADLAISLAGRTSAETYLDVDKVLAACKTTGADAVHPGYGFLSENAAFAEAVIKAGITWVGPPVSTISQMGDKLSAKSLMSKAEVPTLPAKEIGAGEDLMVSAADIGYPVLVKASAGGGGRGMRIVNEPDQLQAAVDGARREAGASFGDDTVFLERWLTSSRHVEIQILGDLHGNLVHLFERECSIQRRHHKVIEEAPSSAVTPEIREKMGEAAVRAAKELGYASAGTVEFLLDGEDFWFLEVNTRLQVEHPVTEEITGLDLVREQLRIAEGEALGYQQTDLHINGHAIEARIYAENPQKNFLPAPGVVDVWQPSNLARFDSGVESGSAVSVEFDPMIAKVICHAPTRREAAAKLARALETTRIQGITNNRDFLVATLRTPEFVRGATTTDFIETVKPTLARAPSQQEIADTAIGTVMFAQTQRRSAAKVLASIPSGWRNSVMPAQTTRFDLSKVNGDEPVEIHYRAQRDGSFSVTTNGYEANVVVHNATDSHIDIAIDGRRQSLSITASDAAWLVHSPLGDIELVELPRFTAPGAAEFKGGLYAPMPGKVLTAEVKTGDQVEAGQLLVILEAMKMEHRITAPIDGVVKEINIKEGDQVANGEMLVVLEALSD